MKFVLIALIVIICVIFGVSQAVAESCEFPCFANKEQTMTLRSKHRKTSSQYKSHVGDNYTLGSGIASYYWQPQRVACGGRFNPQAFTAAHKTYPCGTRVLVRNLNNGLTTTVTINDRGPFVKGRIIDLSLAAAKQIRMTNSGLVRVSIERL